MGFGGIRQLASLAAMVFCCQGFAADIEPSAAGEKIYESYCGACHGFDSSPMMPNVPNFFSGDSLEKSDSELLKAIREGKGFMMPSWQGVLSEQDCQNVLQFIREKHSLMVATATH